MELDPRAPLEVECVNCKHLYCSSCKANPHPRKPCLTDGKIMLDFDFSGSRTMCYSEQKREIRELYNKGDIRTKRELELRYGADNVQFALQDAESEEWIAKHAKPCPKCKTNIQVLT